MWENVRCSDCDPTMYLYHGKPLHIYECNPFFLLKAVLMSHFQGGLLDCSEKFKEF